MKKEYGKFGIVITVKVVIEVPKEKHDCFFPSNL